MGSVYLAEDTRLGRRIALKVINPELADQGDFRQRFEAEARGAAAIEHPNVVPVYAAGLLNGHLYLAMRFVDGENLNQVLDTRGPLSVADASRVSRQVANALDAAHAAGLVHRDVSPANILLEGDLGSEDIYLTDFGLVRGLESGEAQLTRTDQVIANLDYAAPEQIQGGPVDARTDVYALGCVLFRMCSGSRPFPGTDTQKMWKIINDPLPPLGPGGDLLDRVIARATAKDPDRRFPSAGDLARAVEEPEAAVTRRLTERSVAAGSAAVGYVECGQDSALSEPAPAHAPVRDARDSATRILPAGKSAAGRRRAVFLASVAAVLVALGAVAAILIAGGGEDSPTVVRETIRTTTEASTPTDRAFDPEGDAVASRASALPGLETFSGVAYSGFAPVGWDQELVDQPVANYYENVWREPSDPENTFIRVDGGNPLPSESPIAMSESLVDALRQDPRYREIFYGPDFKEGQEAARWVFEIEGDKRVDYFFVSCGRGLASIGSTSRERFPELAPMFREVAFSMKPYCE